jgi:hypothetical protein
MPPEFAQQIQQLFVRQMTLGFLEHCVRLPAPVSLASDRIESLRACSDLADTAALEAEFLLPPSA